MMKRREFITLIGGAASWPLGAGAQHGERMRSVGVLMTFGADEAIGQTRVAALLQGLQQAGREVGRNLRIELRWSGANPGDVRKHAGELAALAPDVIVGNGSAATGPLLEATRSVPIVFVIVPDPVGRGLCRQFGAARRQRYRLHHVRIRHRREMAGITQGDRARRDASGGAS
jgi:putative tryptophan/tyrosine transport system substrate-binding protein